MESATISKKSTAGGWGNFFSSVGSAFTEGVSTIARDIMPVWTANQLDLQSKDQLNNSTIQWESIRNALDAADDYAASKKALFTVGGFQVNAIMVVGGITLGLVIYLFTR